MYCTIAFKPELILFNTKLNNRRRVNAEISCRHGVILGINHYLLWLFATTKLFLSPLKVRRRFIACLFVNVVQRLKGGGGTEEGETFKKIVISVVWTFWKFLDFPCPLEVLSLLKYFVLFFLCVSGLIVVGREAEMKSSYTYNVGIRYLYLY